ncbi:MAG TPA: TylF/MycF family methyltransferase [Chthoniobacterales bacterium]|jgi:O-methyltransferase/8-demethyl-8-(2,3-dimethoxy-alpha-L-rhamnosyl)tetracenomycin-C 4'-O-methyltransferase|nr:TylF/MycF family methyltransferase [Chthoniobacterales bacterium]
MSTSGLSAGEDKRAVIKLYLDLLERVLVGETYQDPSQDPWGEKRFDPARRSMGRDWPLRAHTMIGSRRLHNLRELTERVIHRGVAGDLIETGVWRGGACIMMRAVLAAYGVRDRKVFAADSFEGLPKPDENSFPVDAGDIHHIYPELAVPLEEVEENFRSYGLLDDQVVFLKGWFKETLPAAPIERLAILRLDGDMYESTIQGLNALYPKLSLGGFCIVDDGNVPGCQAAVNDYRRDARISAEIVNIDDWGFYWEKE